MSLDSTFRLLLKGSGLGDTDIETSLEVSSSLVSGGARPLAAAIEYCCRLGVLSIALELAEVVATADVPRPMGIRTSRLGRGPSKDGAKTTFFLGRPRGRLLLRPEDGSLEVTPGTGYFLGLPGAFFLSVFRSRSCSSRSSSPMKSLFSNLSSSAEVT